MSIEDDILIEKYLRKELSKEDLDSFLLRLDSDIALRENLKLEQQLMDALDEGSWSFIENKNQSDFKSYKELLNNDATKNLRKTLEQVNSTFEDNSNKNTRSKWYYLAAASITILICLSIFLNQGENNQQLVNDYLNGSSLPSFVSRGEIATDDLIKAQQFYENEEYQKSIDIFLPAIDTNEANASVYLYTGIAQMRLDKYSDSEITFDKLINSDLLDAQKGHWYKALLYLEQNRLAASKTILESIISNSYHNHSKAKELLEKLNDD